MRLYVISLSHNPTNQEELLVDNLYVRQSTKFIFLNEGGLVDQKRFPTVG